MSYKFFSNKKCKYYPCHKLKKQNCLFCFCPLYFFKDCGGNYKYIKNVKDCSGCLLPHVAQGYDYIITKIKQKLKGRSD